MNTKLKAHLALLGANLIYGASFTVAKTVMPRLIQPYGFIVVRVSFTMLLLWLLFVLKPSDPRIDKQDIKTFLLCAISGIAVNQLMFFKGLSMTFPIHASLLMLTSPILITFIAAFLIRERITPQKILGLLLGIGGALVLVVWGKDVQLNADTVWGDIDVFINAATYAFYLVWVKPLMQKYSPLTVIRWVFTFGWLMVLPFGWKEFTQIPWSAFSFQDGVATGFVVLFTTFFAYLFNTYGLQTLSASTAGAYIYSQPIFAALISVFFYGEHLTGIKILAALFIFSGVYLVGVKRKEVEVLSSSANA